MARMIHRHGEPVVIYNYTETSRDEYGNPQYDKDTIPSKAMIELPRAPDVTINRSGMESLADVVVFIEEDVEIFDAEDETKPSEIERKLTGRRFRVNLTFHENNNIIRCECTNL